MPLNALSTRLQRPCLDCGLLALPGKSRCAVHSQAKARAKNVRRSHAPGDGAAARARYNLNTGQGSALCAHCVRYFVVSLIEVDHRQALTDGGLDVDMNLQYLCRSCHAIKTKQEGAARLPKR